MTLNGTIIVQIINFFIAYLILDRLFLRPYVGSIQKESSELDSLMKDIQKKRESVEKKRHDKAVEWNKFRKKMSTLIPSLMRAGDDFILDDEPAISPISENELSNMIDTVSNSIVQKVVRSDV